MWLPNGRSSPVEEGDFDKEPLELAARSSLCHWANWDQLSLLSTKFLKSFCGGEGGEGVSLLDIQICLFSKSNRTEVHGGLSWLSIWCWLRLRSPDPGDGALMEPVSSSPLSWEYFSPSPSASPYTCALAHSFPLKYINKIFKQKGYRSKIY